MKVSIAIPFYNAEKYLRDSIRSVFAQTHQDWELILMDDGSTDGSLAIAKSIKDSRVSVYSDGKNKKLAARLNEISNLAKYDIIARMDADDLMSPDRIEKQLKILNNNPKLDLVSTGLFSISNNLELTGVRWHHSTYISFDDLLYKNGCGVVHAALLGRKEWFKRNPYDESLKVAQDYDLWIKSKFKNDFKIHLIQEPLYFYREENNINLKKNNLARKYERKLYKQYGGVYKYRLIFRSILKQIAINFIFKIGLKQVLLERRSEKYFSDKIKNEFSHHLSTINKTVI